MFSGIKLHIFQTKNLLHSKCSCWSFNIKELQNFEKRRKMWAQKFLDFKTKHPNLLCHMIVLGKV